MPRNEERPIILSRHAKQQLRKRHIGEDAVERIGRHGATRPDADCDFIASGGHGGRYIEVACLDQGDYIMVKTAY